MSDKIKIGISVGDINGIGLEVILKTFMETKMLDYCTPIIYGHTKVASYHRKALNIGDLMFNVINSPADANPRKVNMINAWEEDVKIELGVANETGGKYAFLSLQKATDDLANGSIDALVTAPINKHNIQSEDFKFPGHTEYLTDRFEAKSSLMMMVSDGLRMGVATGHIPLLEVSKALNADLLRTKITLFLKSLKEDFSIEKLCYCFCSAYKPYCCIISFHFVVLN